MKTKLIFFFMFFFALIESSMACGIHINQRNYSLFQDLDCRLSQSHYGIIIKGNNIVFDGNHHTIYAPHNKFIVYLEGKNITIKNLKIIGSKGFTRAVVAYNVDQLKINNIEAVDHEIAFNYSNDLSYEVNRNFKQIIFNQNTISNSNYGIQFEAKKYPFSPIITNNSFEYTDAAIKTHSQNFRLTQFDNNIFLNSKFAMSLTADQVEIDGIEFDETIEKPIEIYHATQVYLARLYLDRFHKTAITLDTIRFLQLEDVHFANSEIGLRLHIPFRMKTTIVPRHISYGNHGETPFLLLMGRKKSFPNYHFDHEIDLFNNSQSLLVQ